MALFGSENIKVTEGVIELEAQALLIQSCHNNNVLPIPILLNQSRAEPRDFSYCCVVGFIKYEGKIALRLPSQFLLSPSIAGL